MRSTSPSIVDGRTDTLARPGVERSLARTAAPLAAGRVTADHWLVDLLALVLAALLVGATALHGLAVVSTWTAAPSWPSADLAANDGFISASVESGAWDGLSYYHEIR